MIQAFENQVPLIAHNAYVDKCAVVIGRVSIGAASSIWPMAVVRGDVNTIAIGEYSNLQDGTIVHVNHQSPFNPPGDPVVIGDQVTVGHRALLHGCSIGSRCLIGMAACLMDRVVVENDVIVAAGSLVTPGTVLTSGYLWMGAPARRTRKISPEEKDYILYSAQHYFKLSQRHQEIDHPP